MISSGVIFEGFLGRPLVFVDEGLNGEGLGSILFLLGILYIVCELGIINSLLFFDVLTFCEEVGYNRFPTVDVPAVKQP